MASGKVKVQRAIASVPFLLIAAWCFHTMDIEKLVVNQQPFVDSGVIKWNYGEISILDHFHNIDILDQIWRGTTATFSPSTLNYDSIGSWQMFSFLIDLGPVYAIWLLESCRPMNAHTPAYFPTLFGLAGQLLGLGPVAPIFYFLSFTFGPTASELVRSSVRDRIVRHENSLILLMVVLLFHTSEVLAMFLAPDLTTRHFWTWAWQLTPFWIGVSNLLLSKIFGRLFLFPKTAASRSPKLLVSVLGLISTGVWAYTLLYSPYPISTLFVPVAEVQSEFVAHTRKALQADELAVFGSSLLWLAYSFFDLHTAGILGSNWMYHIALLPVIAVCEGPGAAFAVGWYQRERALSSNVDRE
ncbi:hypothetical protein DL768_010050 [Monosporascus sp. mg162]|nr:hypothetical protein DL768_010050 [Monosporascus sp. mg162]